ncbi:hypothetical protein ACNKHR_27500 [Shigella flexneri]
MSAKIGGEGNCRNQYGATGFAFQRSERLSGATYVQMGTLRTDADGALGNTRELNISNAAIVDFNGSTQTVRHSPGRWVGLFCSKRGR